MNFLKDKHVEYIMKLGEEEKDSFEFYVTEHLRMSGIYWALTSLHLLNSIESDTNTIENPENFENSSNSIVNNTIANNSNINKVNKAFGSEMICEFVVKCYDESTGGFGGNVGHDPNLLYTLSSVQILMLLDKLHLVDKEKVSDFVASLQNKKTGSFSGDNWGEVDTRFSYAAISCCSLLGKLNKIDVDLACDFIYSCKNFDEGFGVSPQCESHSGQIFCCVAALAICNKLDRLDVDKLSWWLCERQCKNGGLNGRPEKLADVYYSWWMLSCLSIMGRVDWIDHEKLTEFILNCQDKECGGISDKVGNMADVFHTLFGICGLSLMDNKKYSLQKVDPRYCLPVEVLIKNNIK